MLRFEARGQPSAAWAVGSPLLALLMTTLIGMALFAALGKDPWRGIELFFIEPIRDGYAWGELMVKATPLLLIALGLAVCFRSNVWNIGAEGQFVLGGIAAGGVALLGSAETGAWLNAVVLLAGVLGGMVWAALVAWLRDRFNANEILVSLMLVYVAIQLLYYLVFGPWKDPLGFNFPQTRNFEDGALVPRLFDGSRVHLGLPLALLAAAGAWLLLFRTKLGFAQQVGGLAPRAARYAGFSSRSALWLARLVSGGCAGFAWTRMVPAIEIAGSWDDSFGGSQQITSFLWTQGAYLFHIQQYDNDAKWAVAENDASNEYNAGLFSRFDWHWDAAGDLWYCQTAYDAASAEDALSADAPDSSDLETAGCGGFSWTMMTAAAE